MKLLDLGMVIMGQIYRKFVIDIALFTFFGRFVYCCLFLLVLTHKLNMEVPEHIILFETFKVLKEKVLPFLLGPLNEDKRVICFYFIQMVKQFFLGFL